MDGVLFGHCACAIDDLDGDGERDWAVSAPLAWNDTGEFGCVLFMSSRTHQVMTRVDGATERAMFGWTLARDDDLNDDGVRDLVCGEFVSAMDNERTRTLRILSGKNAGVLQSLAGFERVFCPGARGTDVDLWLHSNAGHEAGGVNARSGKLVTHFDTRAFKFLVALRDESNRPIHELLGVPQADPSSCATTTLEDLDIRMSLAGISWNSYDNIGWELKGVRLTLGTDDVVLSALPDWNNGAGAVFVHSSSTGQLLRHLTLFEARNKDGFDIDLGYAMIAAPDLDGDQRPDVIVSGPEWGMAGGIVLAWSPSTGRTIWQYEGEDGGNVGTSLDLVDDVDGDGVPDLLVGGGQYAPTGRFYANGSVRVLSGKDGKLLDIVLEADVPGLRDRQESSIKPETSRIPIGPPKR